jgi:hypothetical protein
MWWSQFCGVQRVSLLDSRNYRTIAKLGTT